VRAEREHLRGADLAFAFEFAVAHRLSDSEATGVFKIIHNMGAGVRVEDVLFSRRIIGHYRYFQ